MTVTPVGAQLPDDVEQALALARRKRRVRLVEDQDARVLADGAGDLDQLHFRDGEPRDLGIRIERAHAEAGKCGARLTPHLRARHKRHRGPARDRRHHDVLGDAERRAERQLLVDDDDAGCPAVERRTEPDGLAVDPQFALGRLQVAGHDVHQGRLAGAVFTDDGMDFARPDAERNLVERKDAGEPFGYPADFDDIR